MIQYIHMNPKRTSTFEDFIDVMLSGVVVTVGALALSMFALAPFCGGWNEGSMQGTCTPAGIQQMYVSLHNVALMFAITGILWMPLAIIAACASFFVKVLRYIHEFRAGTFSWTTVEIFRILPTLIVGFAFAKLYIF